MLLLDIPHIKTKCDFIMNFRYVLNKIFHTITIISIILDYISMLYHKIYIPKQQNYSLKN